MGGSTEVSFNPFDKPIGYLTPADLDALINRRVPESWTVEYKRDFNYTDGGKVDGKRIARNISSFANSPFGGWLLIGIDERDELPVDIYGLTHNDPVTLVTNIVREHIDPIPLFHFQIVKANGMKGDKVLVIHIPGEQDTPFINRDGNVYRRTNDSSNTIGDDKRMEQVKGRHELDMLVERGRKNVDDFLEFCSDERVCVAPQYAGKTAWLNLFISPYPLGIVNKFDLLSLNEIDNLLHRTRENISVPPGIPNPSHDFVLDNPFYRGHPGYNSVVLRDSDSAGILDFEKILEIFVDGRARLYTPITIMQHIDIKHHLEELGIGVQDPDLLKILSYEYGETEYSDGTSGPVPVLSALHFFNYSMLWGDILWLLVFYQDYFNDEALLTDIRFAITIHNLDGYLVPFTVDAEWLLAANQLGLPMMKNRTVTIPAGVKGGIRMRLESVNARWMFYLDALLSTAFGLHVNNTTVEILKQGDVDYR